MTETSSSGPAGATGEARADDRGDTRSRVTDGLKQGFGVLSAFKDAIEETINDIADNFGLKTIAMTPEELLSQANDYFLKAEDLFTNRAKTGNLRDAIIRYRAVVESLEQFSPKPKMWDRARKQLEQAIKERDAKLEMFNAEYKRLSQMREFAPMREVFLNIMELTEPDSREYARAKRRLVIIDQALRKTKRK
jgi:vacuolar-type H+-ATPase subunit I/STV1